MNVAPASIELLGSLLLHCRQLAMQRLAQTGAFMPFGAFVNARDEIELLAAVSAQASAQEQYALLHAVTTNFAASGLLRAYAIATDVNIPAAYGPAYPDGIRVQLETPGYSRYVYTPYRRLPYRPLRVFFMMSTVAYGGEIPVDVSPDVFPRSP